MKRTVKLIAVDKRYKERPYPLRCIFDDNINTYLTGQHIDPRNPDTHDNLTTDEMTGKVRLSVEKLEKFPFVINPEKAINFSNQQPLDLTTDDKGKNVNPRDAALYNLLRHKTAVWFVAESEEKVIPRTHYFYLHDKIKEAEMRVTTSELAYKAEKYVREELTKEGVFDLALVLQYKISKFHFDPNEYSEVILKDMVLQQCKENPTIVLDGKKPQFKDDIFVLKLALHGILTRRGTDFYDGGEFLGASLEDIKAEIRKEARTAQVSKWNRTLALKEGRLSAGNSDNDKKSEVIEEIKDMDADELKKYAGSKRYNKQDWGHLESREDLMKFLISKVK